MWTSNIDTAERTIKACESFHATFGKNFYVHSSDIYLFVHKIKELQEEIFISMRSNDSRTDFRSSFIQNQANLQLN